MATTKIIKEDKKFAKIKSSILAFSELQKSIKTEVISPADVLAKQFTAVAESLQTLHSASKNMDHSTLVEIPVELLEFLDGDISNPDLYLVKSYEDHENLSEDFNRRLAYLRNIKKDVISQIDASATNSSTITNANTNTNASTDSADSIAIKTEPK